MNEFIEDAKHRIKVGQMALPKKLVGEMILAYESLDALNEQLERKIFVLEAAQPPVATVVEAHDWKPEEVAYCPECNTRYFNSKLNHCAFCVPGKIVFLVYRQQPK